MEQRQLRYFVVLADTLHFGRSSELCHISVSAFSRSIRQLEDSLGVELFRRDNRSVTLTHEGELFQTYARDALNDWEAIRNSLLEEASELYGEVSIYCSVTASYSFLFELLSEFRSAYPHIEIKLHTGDPENAIARVSGGSEDISIGARPETMPPALAFRSIARSPLVFIAARDSEHLRLSGRKPSAAAWKDVPMILSESGLSRQRVDNWFRRLSIRPDIYAQVSGNEAIVSMVSLGFGVGVVPQIVLENSPLAEKVEMLDLRPLLKSYEVGLFAQKRSLKNPLIRALWDASA